MCLKMNKINKLISNLVLFTISVIYFLTYSIDVNGFNLENRLPIIKYGDENTFFGYSVATHSTGRKDELDSKKWLLVGAPLGQNLQPNTNRSGALFKCPITQLTNDCEQIMTDGLNSTDEKPILYEPVFDEEIKTGQWLGVTVRSQGYGGKVLVCAHRYINKQGESQYGQGLCYVLTNELDYWDTYETCKGRSTLRNHEEYGYCQVGTSGTILDDDTMILGSPGPFTWRGTIFVISIEDNYLKRDKIQYYGPHTDITSPVDKYSYLGMSVTGGRYFGKHMSYAAGAPRSSGHGQVVIMSKGTPITTNPMSVTKILDGEQFASSFGYELITADINGDSLADLIVAAPFYFGRHEGGAVYVYQNENYNLPLKPTLKLTGKIESHFGIALTNMGDINKDNCDDIAIGAPYDGNGVVFIYLGSPNGLSSKPAQIISANDLGLLPHNLQPLTSFGSSLAGTIDLDNNSYPDLLIGAYASSSIFALLSRPIINIKTEVRSNELKHIDPSVQGCPSDPTTNLTCFSFKACCSIEPYESTPMKTLDLIYIIEAETYNNVKKFSRVFFGSDFEKHNHMIRKQISVQTNSLMDCHEEIVYVKENTRDIQSPIKFRLNYTIVEPKLPPSALIALHPILDQIQADRPFEATFQKDCGTDDICESQLEVFAELELNREDNQYALVLGKNKELNLTVTVTNTNDSAYESQLFVEHQPSVTYIAASKGSVICNRFNKTIVSCALGNPMKRDGSAQVLLRFDPSGLEDSEPKLSFKIFANSTSKQIIPRERTVLNVRVIKRAELSIKGWRLPEQSFYGGGEIRNENFMKYFDDCGTSVQHTYQIYNAGPWRSPYLEVHFLWPYQTISSSSTVTTTSSDKQQQDNKWLLYLEEKPFVEGGSGGECFINPLTLINPLQLQKQPKLKDISTDEMIKKILASTLMANIGSFGNNGGNNKSATLVAESSETRLKSSTSTTSSSSSSSSSSKYTSSNLNRVKRDEFMNIRSEELVHEDGRKKDIVHLNCETKTAKCIKFHCVIYNMQSTSEAYIHIKARLWNSTLVADYPRVDLVSINSYAQIKIPEMYGIQQSTRDDIATVDTRAYPELLDPGSAPIPLWAIILAVVSGLLLLALFTFVLWKCGFFKRRRPDPTLSGNLEKNSENKHLLKNNKK